uniref:(northern house mosquito) hypothetical protein n=1 Tax=Culex pipiens TaxID=7175 RepID=A0A8D8AR26_CULPI
MQSGNAEPEPPAPPISFCVCCIMASIIFFMSGTTVEFIWSLTSWSIRCGKLSIAGRLFSFASTHFFSSGMWMFFIWLSTTCCRLAAVGSFCLLDPGRPPLPNTPPDRSASDRHECDL